VSLPGRPAAAPVTPALPVAAFRSMTVSMTDQRMGPHDVVMTLSSIEVKE